MSFTTVRDDLVTQLRAVTNFSSTNVDYDTTRHLNAGPLRATSVMYDSVEIEEWDLGDHMRHWRFTVFLFERKQPDAQDAAERAATDREAVLNRIRQYPRLGGTNVFHAVVEDGRDSGGEARFGNVPYTWETLTVRADELVAINAQE